MSIGVLVLVYFTSIRRLLKAAIANLTLSNTFQVLNMLRPPQKVDFCSFSEDFDLTHG